MAIQDFATYLVVLGLSTWTFRSWWRDFRIAKVSLKPGQEIWAMDPVFEFGIGIMILFDLYCLQQLSVGIVRLITG